MQLVFSAAWRLSLTIAAGFDQSWPVSVSESSLNDEIRRVVGAGLAGLVAPAVANAGVIDAKLGHVVLAGAKTATLDLYGDKLVSLNVTGAVTKAPDGVDALVTNTGVVLATFAPGVNSVFRVSGPTSQSRRTDGGLTTASVSFSSRHCSLEVIIGTVR